MKRNMKKTEMLGVPRYLARILMQSTELSKIYEYNRDEEEEYGNYVYCGHDADIVHINLSEDDADIRWFEDKDDAIEFLHSEMEYDPDNVNIIINKINKLS